MILRHAFIILFAAALLPPLALAGQIVDLSTGSIAGTARDATGAVLQGVEIAVTGDALMGSRKVRTNTDGHFRIPALPPGDYRLSFVLRGFNTTAHEVRVGLGFTATVDVTLALAAQRDAVTVSRDNGSLDRHSAAITETFEAREIDSLPTSRSLGGLLSATHGLYVPTVEVGGGSGIVSGTLSAYGRNASPRYTIEGIVVTGLFGAGFAPDYGAFEELSVLTAAHGAEWPTAGLHTQLVTKSGANRFTGTIYGAYENRHWQSFNVDSEQIARFAPSGGGLSARQANQMWRNRDLNADAGGFVVKDRLWWYSSFRDQETASRLVNFPVEPFLTQQKNVSGKISYQLSPGHRLIAYGQWGRNHQPHRLDPFGAAGSDLSAETAINLSSDSTVDQRNTSWLWKGEWNAVLRDTLLVEGRGGQFAGEQDWTGRSDAPRFEDVDTLLVSGGNRDWHLSSRRNQLFGTLNYFKDGWFGSHHLKIGGEAIRFLVQETWFRAYPGNVLHVVRSGNPSSVFVFSAPSLSASGVWTYAAYASDSWRLDDRLTVTLGLRFDRYRMFLPAQEHPAGASTAQQFAAVDNLIDWNTMVPRIAVVYDLTGDGRTLAKASFARYRNAPNAAVGFNANPNSAVWWTLYEWTDSNASGVWEPGEETRRQRRRGGVATESLDPALRLPVLDEVAGWLERELPGGVAVRTGAVWRHERSQFARQNANQPFDGFTVPVTLQDPGPDGVAGTGDDGSALTAYDLRPEFDDLATVNVLRNVPGSSSDYWTLEVAANRRMRDRWSLAGGFAHTWNRDQASGYSGQTIRNNPYPVTPNDLIGAGPGGRHEFTTWTAKVHGTYDTPLGLRVSSVLRHQSGQPFGRTFTDELDNYGTVTVLAEPVGTRRMDNITLLDVRVEKQVTLKAHRLAVFMDVFNSLNANPEQNAIWSSGQSFLRPVTIVPPRVARVGATFNW